MGCSAGNRVTDWRAQAATVPCFLRGQVGKAGCLPGIFCKAILRPGRFLEAFPVSAYVGSSKNLKDLKEKWKMAKRPASGRQRGIMDYGALSSKPSSEESSE